MKNVIILIVFLSSSLFSASIVLNEAKDDNKTFSVLHIRDDYDFSCSEELQKNFKNIVICQFSKNIEPSVLKSNRDFKIKSDANILKIIPLHKLSLKHIQDNFINTNTITQNNKGSYKHWMVIGYEKKPSFLIDNSSYDGINFDIAFQNHGLPFVGSLDLDALPIVQKGDAIGMRRVKEAFKEKDYQRVIKFTNELLSSKDKLFSQEAGLYKLRALDKLASVSNESLNDYVDDILNSATSWLKNNPSSKYIPEVLMYLAKYNYKLGQLKKADEYLKTLDNEFNDSKFREIATIYKADAIYQNRRRQNESIKLYKDILYSTKKLDIASLAAMRIADKYLLKNKPKLASEFYKKIVKADEEQIVKDLNKAYNFAKRFAKQKEYDTALEILGILINKEDDKIKKSEMLKDMAYWYELNGDKKIAFGLYKQYIKDYPKGEFIDFVKSRLDRVLLDVGDDNSSKQLENINNVLKNYKNEPIYKKALLQKAQILIKQRDFDKILQMADGLRKYGGEDLLKYAAQKVVESKLKEHDCKSSILIGHQYHVLIPKQEQFQYVKCLVDVGGYEEALKIQKEHINEKDLSKKLEWLYVGLQIYSKLGLDKKVILLSKDIEKLSQVLHTNKYNDVVYYAATAYYNLGKYQDLMLREVEKAEKLFPDNVKNIDLYVQVIKSAKRSKSDLLIVNYAKKVLNLQKKYKLTDYTPQIDLEYINALKRLNQYEKALKADLALLYIGLTDKQKANVLYLAGELSLKLNRSKEAKGFFMKCGEIVEDSAWQRLCAQSLKLLDE